VISYQKLGSEFQREDEVKKGEIPREYEVKKGEIPREDEVL
jgi:hypothetical protein